jgi:hypothetical protein
MISLQVGDGMVCSFISLQVGYCCYMEPNQIERLNFPYFYRCGFPSNCCYCIKVSSVIFLLANIKETLIFNQHKY